MGLTALAHETTIALVEDGALGPQLDMGNSGPEGWEPLALVKGLGAVPSVGIVSIG